MLSFILIHCLVKLFSGKNTTFLTKINSQNLEPEHDYCNQKLHSPINISTPFEYHKFLLNFKFYHLTNLKMVKEKEQTFRIQGNFGEIVYENLTFTIKHLVIKFPGEHRFADLGYSMEFQVEAETDKRQKIVVVLPFEVRNDYKNEKLDRFYFSKNLAKMNLNSFLSVQNLNLDTFLGNKQRFYMYQGQSTNQNCKFALVFVSVDTEFIGIKQLAGYGVKAAPVNEISEFIPKMIYQNFLVFNDSYFVNWLINRQVLFHSDFILPMEYSNFAYTPSFNKL